MKSILFNTEMVRAIQNGTKTVTRRVVKPQPEIMPIPTFGNSYRISMERNVFVRPPCNPGDILYVRETFGVITAPDGTMPVFVYKADCPKAIMKWRSSTHMPREAARLFLRVTDVRVERLQDIRPTGIILEGVLTPPGKSFSREETFDRMREVWDSTIKPKYRAKYGWEANPWVWVIAFEKISREEAEHEA